MTADLMNIVITRSLEEPGTGKSWDLGARRKQELELCLLTKALYLVTWLEAVFSTMNHVVIHLS